MKSTGQFKIPLSYKYSDKIVKNLSSRLKSLSLEKTFPLTHFVNQTFIIYEKAEPDIGIFKHIWLKIFFWEKGDKI